MSSGRARRSTARAIWTRETVWRHAIKILRTDIARRLGLVALAADRDPVVPEDDSELNRLVTIARQRRSGASHPTVTASLRSLHQRGELHRTTSIRKKAPSGIAIGGADVSVDASQITVAESVAFLIRRSCST